MLHSPFTTYFSVVFKRKNNREDDSEYGDDVASRVVSSIYELGTQVSLN